MTQSFSQLVTRYQSAEFQDQCLWSVLFLLRYIDNESSDTPNHAARILWSKASMANPAQMARSMSAYVASDYNCINDTAPTDQQVLAALEVLVNRYTE
jgi:hypothetical protein